MTNEMIERVAKVIYEAEHPGLNFLLDASDYAKRICNSQAKAAIAAMREPTEEMIYAGSGTDSITARWEAMIDKVLE